MSRHGVEAAAAGEGEAGDTEGISDRVKLSGTLARRRMGAMTRQQWSAARSCGTPSLPFK
ncbi:MAG: hypothetical protein LZF62_140083 [Nitrospira sp.]|nr:MAG: hypothetical protein LZF62_140083 [Nitrospira sp.]